MDLREPFKVGDWVKVTDGCDSFIGKIAHLEDNELSFDLIPVNYILAGYEVIKLTPEQIEVLGLE